MSDSWKKVNIRKCAVDNTSVFQIKLTKPCSLNGLNCSMEANRNCFRWKTHQIIFILGVCAVTVEDGNYTSHSPPTSLSSSAPFRPSLSPTQQPRLDGMEQQVADADRQLAGSQKHPDVIRPIGSLWIGSDLIVIRSPIG